MEAVKHENMSFAFSFAVSGIISLVDTVFKSFDILHN